MIRILVFKARRAARWLPAVLMWAAFPPFAEKSDIFFALAPLLWYSRNRAPGASARIWFGNGLLYWVLTLSWMHAIVKNGGPWPLVILGWFALAAVCALFFGAFGWLASVLWQWTKGRGYGWRLAMLLVAEPVLWAGTELVRSTLFGGFSWNHLGSVPANMGLGAPAALGGVYLLSAVVILVNGTLASVAERMLARGASFGRCVETILPLAAVWALYSSAGAGEAARAQAAAAGERRVLAAALVQRNFPCAFAAPDGESPLAAYDRLLGAVAPSSPDIVILPESALAEFGPAGSRAADGFAARVMAQTGARAVLAGCSRAGGDGRLYNSAALYSGSGGVQTYDKVHLVPFGEYIPGDKTFPVLQKLAPVGSCWPGEKRLLDFDGVKLGVAICFEDTDAALTRDFARMGADALVFITNDSWFSHSAEAVQHAWQSVARAIETGLPVLRAGNSGVTGTVSPDGKAQWLRGAGAHVLLDEKGAMVQRIPMPAKRPAPTLYVRLGDAPLAAAFAVLAAAALFLEARRLYRLRRLAAA